MGYRGIVRGKVIELEDQVVLPEGTEVVVVVRATAEQELAPSGHLKGSPRALLAALATPPHCTPEDVEALTQSIDHGKQPVRFAGVFDPEADAG